MTEPESIGKVTVLDEMKRRKHGDSAIPQAIRRRKMRQQFPVGPFEVRPHDIRGAGIDQIPIVDPPSVAQIQPKQSLTNGHRAASVLPREDEQAKETLFVEWGPDERLDRTW